MDRQNHEAPISQQPQLSQTPEIDPFADPQPEDHGHKMPDVLQLLIYVWVPGKGYLTTRRGITMCNLSGAKPENPLTDEEMFMLEAKAGYRAIKAGLKRHAESG
jgi:hypothetical protein